MATTKKKPKANSYTKIGEYFRKDSRAGVRFGTLKTDDGSKLVLLSLIEKGIGPNEGQVFSIQRTMGNGNTKPANFSLNPKATRIFRELLDQAIKAAKE